MIITKPTLSFNRPEIIGLIVLLLLMYFPLFGHLGNLTIRIWDEARVTVNAYEMWQTGDLLVTKYMGNPDLWNTKPPLLIWIQAFLLNFFDDIELAMRLPSALAGASTILLIYYFVKKQTQNFWTGFIAAVVLLSSKGYIEVHGTRTGDYDALLVFFTTLACLMFWLFIEHKQTKYLYFFFLSTALGVLTKSISALMFLPALFLYTLYRKQLFEILKNKHFYFGIFVFTLITAGYYFLRELAAPGYLKAVGENELWGRYLSTLENHNEPFRFYYDHLVNGRYKAFYLLLPVGAISGIFLLSNHHIRNLAIFSTLLIVSYFFIISYAKTKLVWYDLPLYPFFAILVSFAIGYLIQLRRQLNSSIIFVKVGKYLILIFIFGFLTQQIVLITRQSYKPKDNPYEGTDYTLTYYLRDALHGKHDLNNIYVIYDGYNTMLKPYIYQQKGKGAYRSGDLLVYGSD
jgi:4-amino-4-deoxy-L-arabinose transferase-like glycosyltransferase